MMYPNTGTIACTSHRRENKNEYFLALKIWSKKNEKQTIDIVKHGYTIEQAMEDCNKYNKMHLDVDVSEVRKEILKIAKHFFKFHSAPSDKGGMKTKYQDVVIRMKKEGVKS